MYEGTFHEAVGTILTIAQLFGMLPVQNVKSKNPSKLKFTKCSLRFFLCLFAIFGTAWISILDIRWIASTKIEFGKLITLTFDATNCISILCFLELAKKWPKLMQEWYKIEKSLPQMRYQLDKQKMAYNIKMASFVVLFGSMSKSEKFCRKF
jgi:gustatory receptor